MTCFMYYEFLQLLYILSAKILQVSWVFSFGMFIVRGKSIIRHAGNQRKVPFKNGSF